MKTKILYVLVSSPEDIYLEQAFVSISSLRHQMGRKVEVVVLMDTITESFLGKKRMEMLQDVDEIISVELSAELSAQNRSRILKTSARKHLKGDFLFIDCDTIITKPLDSIDEITADIAACCDSHSAFKDNPYREMCISHCKKLGIDISREEKYYNSGVIYVKDTPAAHDFYERWHKNWLEGREKGVNMDQPAFNKTNIESGYMIQTLGDVWNCEILHGIKFLKDAKIVHYLCTNITSGKGEEIFIMRNMNVLQDVKKTGLIPFEVKVCFEDPFKGIPSLTTLVSGKNNAILRTSLYQYLSARYNTKVFNVLDRFVKTMNNAKNKLVRNI